MRHSTALLSSAERYSVRDIHMDDVHGGGGATSIRNFVASWEGEPQFKSGGNSEKGEPYDHLKRMRTKS